MKRLICLVVGVQATMMVIAPVAAHAAYPPGSATVSASSSSPQPGAPITLTVAGFCASAAVTFAIGATTLGTATSGSTGSASITTDAPTTPGAYTVTASTTDVDCPLTASLALTVVAGATGGARLPGAGSDTSNGLYIGGMAVLLGAGMLGVAAFRRRRRVTIAN